MMLQEREQRQAQGQGQGQGRQQQEQRADRAARFVWQEDDIEIEEPPVADKGKGASKG